MQHLYPDVTCSGQSWSRTDGSPTGTFSSAVDSSESEILSGGSVSSEQPFGLSPGSFSFSPHSARPESGPQPPGLRTAEPDSKPLCRSQPNPQGVLRDTAGRLRADETHRAHLPPGLTCRLDSPACNRIPARFPRSTCWSGCPTDRLRSTACWINDRASSW